MMKDKKVLWIVSAVAVAIAVAAGVACIIMLRRAKQEQKAHISTNDYSTNSTIYYSGELPPADPMMVGKWHNIQNPQWHKVYYDDYDEDEKLFWGKEWDEADDVYEEDLDYHGNGWFRWEKKDNVLREYATMSTRDVPIHRGYTIRKLTSDSLIYYEMGYKNVIFRFVRESQ